MQREPVDSNSDAEDAIGSTFLLQGRRSVRFSGRPRTNNRLLRIEMLEDRRMLAVDFTLLKDIHTFIRSSNPSEAVEVGSLTFFAADSTTSRTELWKTDGTAAGTV